MRAFVFSKREETDRSLAIDMTTARSASDCWYAFALLLDPAPVSPGFQNYKYVSKRLEERRRYGCSIQCNFGFCLFEMTLVFSGFLKYRIERLTEPLSLLSAASMPRKSGLS